MRSVFTLALCILIGLMFLRLDRVYAEKGIPKAEIMLGQSCALEGPAQALGLGMKAGLEACFEVVNSTGGIHGRKILLISRNDGYEPEMAMENTRELIELEQVFLLIGEVGTPTSKTAVPIAGASKVPFFAPFTGAEFLRNPVNRYVINIRGSYYQEMEKLAEYLIDENKLSRIACFFQNDGYGQAGLKGLENALERRQMELIATGVYERNTIAVKSGLLKIRKAEPDAIVMVGAYKPCAEFIKQAKKIGMQDVIYCNISFVGTSALLTELGEMGEGCVISQVVPFPWDTSLPIVEEFHKAMKTYQNTHPGSEPGFVSLEGYLAGTLFCEVLRNMDGDISRENFIDTLDAIGTFDLGGVVLQYSSTDHQGMNEVFLTIIKNGRIQPL